MHSLLWFLRGLGSFAWRWKIPPRRRHILRVHLEHSFLDLTLASKEIQIFLSWWFFPMRQDCLTGWALTQSRIKIWTSQYQPPYFWRPQVGIPIRHQCICRSCDVVMVLGEQYPSDTQNYTGMVDGCTPLLPLIPWNWNWCLVWLWISNIGVHRKKFLDDQGEFGKVKLEKQDNRINIRVSAGWESIEAS